MKPMKFLDEKDHFYEKKHFQTSTKALKVQLNNNGLHDDLKLI